ncbi:MULTISPECIES: hypothetical protein [unclassified Nocardiopsis]|uniref:hypothetical protein n=1 Tax=Nocardiopsis TaxID=2013 RepID=UPI00387B2E01
MTRRRKQTPKRRPYRPSRGRSSHGPVELPPSPAGVRLDRLSLRDAVGIGAMLAVFSAALVGGGFIGGGDDLITRWEYATRAETAEATVAAVIGGRPEVVFTTADGTEVTTVARGSHRHGDPLAAEVLYLPADPQEASLPEGLWVPPILYCLPLALAVLVLAVRHPRGPHDLLYRARVRAYKRRKPLERVFTRPIVLRSVAGAVLAISAAVLLPSGLVMAASARPAEAELPAGTIASVIVGGALIGPAAYLLFQARWRYLERAPREKPPAPPSLLSDRAHLALLCSPVVVLLLAAVFALLIEEKPVTTPVQGTARVLAVGCGDVIGRARGCNDAVALGYEVDGVLYQSVLRTRSWTYHEGQEVPVVWDADDPSNVRLDEAEATSGRYPGFRVGTAE